MANRHPEETISYETAVLINGEEYKPVKIGLPSTHPTNTSFVFLGESNFTFSTAFAAQRGSWEGVVPTTYLPEGDPLSAISKTPFLPSNEQTLKEAAIREYFLGTDLVCTDPAVQGHITAWRDTFSDCKTVNQKDSPDARVLNEWINDLNTTNKKKIQQFPIRYHLDATYMGHREELQKRLKEIKLNSPITLWFQCPWVSKHCTFLKNLMKKIIESAALFQHEGEFLLLGISTSSQHVDAYGKLQENAKGFYECVGADTSFVGEMLYRGYVHQTSGGGSLYPPLESHQFATILFKRRVGFNCQVPILGELYLMQQRANVSLRVTDDYTNKFTLVRKLTREKWLEIKNFFDHPQEADPIKLELGFQFELNIQKNTEKWVDLYREPIIEESINCVRKSCFNEVMWKWWTANKMHRHVDALFAQAEAAKAADGATG